MNTKKKKIKPKLIKTVPIKTVIKKPKINVAILKEYDITQRTHERREALQRDTENWGALKVLRQLDQMREAVQWNPRVHEIITRDLEFLQKFYQRAGKN